MTVTLPGPLLLACVTLGLPAVLVLNEARHVLRARRRDRRRPPVPGNATCSPTVAAPPLAPPARRQPPAPGPHGGHVATVNIFADGYTTTAYTTTGHTEVRYGECPQCAAAQGNCTWCGFYPSLRSDGREVYRYQRCPAHTEARQP